MSFSLRSWIAVVLLAIAWQLPYFDRWMSPMDEGHIAAYAELLAQGGELHRDATLLPLPGAFYLLEIAFRIFGPSLLLARWIVVFEFALLWLIAFLLLGRPVPLAVAWAGVGAMLGLLLAPREREATAAVSQVALARVRDGLTIPLHPEAERWLAAHGAPAGAPAPR